MTIQIDTHAGDCVTVHRREDGSVRLTLVLASTDGGSGSMDVLLRPTYAKRLADALLECTQRTQEPRGAPGS